jgi:REP element-mobilizing transposase RayT
VSDPLAFFLTFTTYGTRLHGDDRGTVDRGHNTFGSRVLRPDPGRREFTRQRLAGPPMTLGATHRQVVEAAIREVCRTRGWRLHAVHARSNHVHVVASASVEPEVLLTTFKAWATRRLRDADLVTSDARVWTRHGSTRYLWTDPDVESAIFYVVELQGVELD